MKRAAAARIRAIWLALSGLCLVACGAPLGYVQAEAGVVPALLLADLPPGLELPAEVHLVAGSTTLPAQVSGNKLALVLPVGDRTVLAVETGAADSPALVLAETPEAITVRHGEVEILCYRKALVQPPAGIAPINARNAYLHPVRTPAGRVVTDDFAPDHPHQRGVFCAWTKTKAGGRTVDFWNLPKGEGTVRYAETLRAASGPVFAEFAVRQEHLDLKAPAAERIALTETLTVRVWTVGNAHVLDLESVQEAPRGLDLPTYLYGGMAFRGARSWRKGQMEYLTDSGPCREAPFQGKPTRTAWCDMAGPVDGAWAGMLALADPANFRFPEPVRLLPSDPYFCFAPSQLGEWRFAPGEPRTFRYRLVVHDDRVTAADAAGWQQTYIHPPEVRFSIERPQP